MSAIELVQDQVTLLHEGSEGPVYRRVVDKFSKNQPEAQLEFCEYSPTLSLLIPVYY